MGVKVWTRFGQSSQETHIHPTAVAWESLENGTLVVYSATGSAHKTYNASHWLTAEVYMGDEDGTTDEG